MTDLNSKKKEEVGSRQFRRGEQTGPGEVA